MKSFIALYTMPCIVLICQLFVCSGNPKILPVPMAFRILVQRREHDREDDFHVIADEIAEIFIVPKVKSPLRHLQRLHKSCDNQSGSGLLTWK